MTDNSIKVLLVEDHMMIRMGTSLVIEKTDGITLIGEAEDGLQGVEKAKMFDIVEKIRTISDPEIPLNVYDMGLIYKIDQRDNGDIYIEMTVTAPTCPIAGELPQQVADALTEVAGTGRIEVKIVWEPAWTPERMTDEAKEMLELI